MNKMFLKAYIELEKAILKDNDLKKEVKLIALLGSVSQKEEVTGWSDLDVLIILKSDTFGNIGQPILDKLKLITANISGSYSFPISILTHTQYDLINYVSFEYLNHYSQGNCTFPNKTELKELIKEILIKRPISKEDQLKHFIYHFRHIRFNLVRKYVSLNQYNNSQPVKEFVKLLIDEMIKVSDLALNFEGQWPKKKYEIYKKLKLLRKIDTKPLKLALEIRKNWVTVDENKLKSFIPIGLNYVKVVLDFYLSIYANITPEESLEI